MSGGKIGFKVTIVNNTNDDIQGGFVGALEKNYILLGKTDLTTIQSNSTLSKSFLSFSDDKYSFFNSIVFPGAEENLNIICSSNNWAINYGQDKLGDGSWSIIYEGPNPNTEDITITINPSDDPTEFAEI